MDHTQNLNLPQWDAEDRILRTDFNAAMSAIDTAVGAKADADTVGALQSAVSTAGNCRIAFGTYTGTGSHGADAPNTITFDFTPRLVIVSCCLGSSGSPLTPLILFRDEQNSADYCGAPLFAYNSNYLIQAAWNGNTVSWYSQYTDTNQCNKAGRIYSYMALG